MSSPRLLDLFCGAGGAAMGYDRAGFDVVGVDIRPQPNYPFEFVQGSALDDAVWRYLHVEHFDAIHASPPCQFYAGLSRGDHWRSIPPTRELLEQTGLPYVIENIADAAWDMREPVRLCGSMFGLHVRRHRLFETTLPFFMQPPCQHAAQGEIRAYYGKPGWAAWTPKAAVVNGGDRKPLLRGSVEQAKEDMGIDWMTWDELREAIPPAYTEFIGHQLLAPDLADWLVHIDLEGKASRTVYTYHREIARLLRAYPLHELADFTHTDLSTVLREVPPRSRHITRSIYNQFFEWAVLDERLDRTPMLRVPKIKHPRRVTRNIFTLAEVAQLEALPTPDGQLFAILFGSGIRKAEARRLQRQHVDLDRRRLIVHQGKGGKDRVVALTPSALQAVADLDITEGLRPEDHLWHSRPGGGTLVSRRFPIGDSTYSRWYALSVEQAGVPYLSPHTTRHTYHELMRLAGLTLEERQLLMGHASIRTTADIYGHLDFDAVADKLADFSLERL